MNREMAAVIVVAVSVLIASSFVTSAFAQESKPKTVTPKPPIVPLVDLGEDLNEQTKENCSDYSEETCEHIQDITGPMTIFWGLMGVAGVLFVVDRITGVVRSLFFR